MPRKSTAFSVVLMGLIFVPTVMAGEFGDAATDFESRVDDLTAKSIQQDAEIQILRGNVSELDARVQALEEGQPPPEVGCQGAEIPGRIEAENFTEGGQRVAYNDSTPNENLGGAYRVDEGVDIKATGDSDGEYQVGYVVDGEWLKYATCVTAGTYDIKLRVTSAASAPGNIEVVLGGVSLGNVDVPHTGSWDTNFTTVIIPSVTVNEGEQSLEFKFTGKSLDINWVEFAVPGQAALWKDDFASSWRSRWPTKWSEPDNKYAKQEYFERDGETWMRVIYPVGKTGAGMKFVSDYSSSDRLTVEYNVLFASDFDWVLGGKLPGLGAGSVSPGQPPDGTDGWLARLMWLQDGKGIAYVYHPDMPGKWGENIHFAGGVKFQRNKIHTVRVEVVLNTPTRHDGILRVWLDGALVVERTNMRWRDVDSLQIDGISFSTFFGGSTADWAPSKDETAEFGDFKLFK